jgi:hypothetical protein
MYQYSKKNILIGAKPNALVAKKSSPMKKTNLPGDLTEDLVAN